jgi:hypothetical protein
MSHDHPSTAPDDTRWLLLADGTLELLGLIIQHGIPLDLKCLKESNRTFDCAAAQSAERIATAEFTSDEALQAAARWGEPSSSL